MTKEQVVALAFHHGPIVLAAAGGWLTRHWWPQAEPRITSAIEHDLDHMNPVLRSLALRADAFVADVAPDAGAARCAVATDALLRALPVLTPFRGILLSGLTASEGAAQKIAQQVKADETGKQAPPAAPTAS